MLRRYILLCLFGITIGTMQLKQRCLENKIAVVTGAAQGIGYAIADHFLAAGVEVLIMVDKQKKKGHDAAEQLNKIHGGNRAVFIHGDVRKDLEEVFHRIWKEYYYIDVLVNNAGVSNEYCPEETIGTNTLAVVEWSLKFWRRMRKDRDGKGGTIINLASAVGYHIFPFLTVYTASKYAVIGFSKNLGHEYNSRRTGVRVLTLCPGFTDTAMTGDPKVWVDQFEEYNKLKNVSLWQKPDDVGRGAVQVFENAESGTAWTIEGGNAPVESPVSEYVTAAYIDSLF